MRQAATDLEIATVHFNSEVAKLDAYISAKGPATDGEHPLPPPTLPTQEEAAVITPNDVDFQAITKHITEDPKYQGTGEEAVGLAHSMIDMLNSIAMKKYEAAQQARSSTDDVSMTHVMVGGRARPVRPGSTLALANTAAQPLAAGKRDGEVDPAAEPAAKKPIVSAVVA